MQLYGRQWTKRELEARIGHLHQVGGVRRMMLTEGKEAGTEIIRVRTGGGLVFDVVPSKGLDISLTELRGIPISWQSPNGDVHPAYYDQEGTAWLRTASGGLLMTCGPSFVGSPGTDGEGARQGLHGRFHHTPAAQVSAVQTWDGDELEMKVSGVVEETALFGSKLRIHREIAADLGRNRIRIVDRVENFGFKPAVHMMLYHFNFGFPLLDEATVLQVPDADSSFFGGEDPVQRHDAWTAEPIPAGVEGVYYHRLREGAAAGDGMAEAVLYNPRFPSSRGTEELRVRLRWSADTLPMLVQWKAQGAGEYALGLEPANCGVGGFEAEKRGGGPVMLSPGEVVTHRLELDFQ